MVLRDRHHKAVEMLARTNMTFTEIARKLKISERTLSRWLKNEDFRALLEEFQEQHRYRAEEMRDIGVAMLMARAVESIHRGGGMTDISSHIARLEKLTRLMTRGEKAARAPKNP